MIKSSTKVILLQIKQIKEDKKSASLVIN